MRITLLFAGIAMGANAEAKVRILVDHGTFFRSLAKLRFNEFLVIERFLNKTTDLLLATKARVSLQSGTAV
jgi:hypothetical protein